MLVIRWFDLGDGRLVPAYPGDQAPGCATFLGVTVASDQETFRAMGDLLVAWLDGLAD